MPYEIPAPMLAKSVPEVPDQDKVPGGLSYEPKWDGFRGLVSWDGEDVEIGSRGAKPLTRYFPELVEAFSRLLPEPCLLDGEVVVPKGEPGAQRLDWDSLTQRIHPAASRVEHARRDDARDVHRVRPARPRRPRPAVGAVRGAARRARRPARRRAASAARDQDDDGCRDRARAGSSEFEGAGLDGVVAKPLAQPYAPNKRTMFKIKHARTADVVAMGYRIHKSGEGVGSLLVGLYSEDGHAVPGRRRRRLDQRPAPRAHRRARTARRTRRSRRRGQERGREVAVLRDRIATRRSCTSGRSACSRCATTSSRDGGSGTRCSSSGGGPTAMPSPARTTSSRPSRPTTSATCWTESVRSPRSLRLDVER